MKGIHVLKAIYEQYLIIILGPKFFFRLGQNGLRNFSDLGQLSHTNVLQSESLPANNMMKEIFRFYYLLFRTVNDK